MKSTSRACHGFILAIWLFSTSVWAEGPKHGQLSAVPYTAVEFHDTFWIPRLRVNRDKSIPYIFQCCEQTGRIGNFAKAAKLIGGNHEGTCANDSDVFKLIEGASYALAADRDPSLERMVDAAIAKIAAAQQPDGYLNTYYTLAEPGKRWTDLKDKHELYCAGHLFEAAVAHWRATGKRTLLGVATRYADCIDNTFGPAKRLGLCGHEEIELALVKLYEATGEERYFNLARFFLDLRGDKSRRTLWGPYYQDHVPVRKQSEVVGHAVRAMYLNCAMTDVALHTGDRSLIDAADRLWTDVVERKMYVTGGIGARHDGESFGDAYELPNDSAYCETCAAIGLALWAHRMNLLHGDAQYVDVLERVLYNGILSGVSLDGCHFFYVNPLASDSRQHRQPFLDPACCPTNIVRFFPTLPGYVYAVGNDGIYVNLYVAGTAKINFGAHAVTLTQRTRYPWDGLVRIAVDPGKPREFTLALRIPGWCEGTKMALNGQPAHALDVSNGYARLRREWRHGDVVELTMPMPVCRIQADPRVRACAGRVAIRRGPLVYCFETADNDGPVKDIVLGRDPMFTWEYRSDLLGGVVTIAGVAPNGRTVRAVPYYAWDNRTPGEMIVWVGRDSHTIH